MASTITNDLYGAVILDPESCFTVDFGGDNVNTYMAPDSERAGVITNVTGSQNVTQIAWYNNGEYWKVETTDPNTNAVTTAWVKREDFVTGEDGHSIERYVSGGEFDKYFAASHSQEAYKAHTKSIEHQLEKERAAHPDEYTTTEFELQQELDRYNFDTDAGKVKLSVNQNAYVLLLKPSDEFKNLSEYADKLKRVFGMPPQWTLYVDPRANFESALVGRRYAETILSSPSILSLCPGKLEYSQGLIDDFTSDADMMAALSSGNHEPFWHFKGLWSNTAGEGGSYVDCANTMCKYAACCLSVNGELEEGGEIALCYRPTAWGKKIYMTMDVNDFLDPGSATMPEDGETEESTGSSSSPWSAAWGAISGILSGLPSLLKNAAAIAIEGATTLNEKFVNFNLNGQVGMGEDFNTETRASVIENLISGAVDNTIKDINFMINGAMGSDVESDLLAFDEVAKSTLGGTIGALLSAGHEMLRGGSISFPKVIDNCTWGRSFNFNVKFTSVYGDVESRFLNVVMPYLCLCAFFLPKQLKHKVDMWTYPPVVRAFVQGVYACDIGVLTGISVKRGGEDDSMWTASGQPMEIDVSFTIQSLHQNLMQSDSLPWLAKNVGLQLYVGTICGVDMAMPQPDLIAKTTAAYMGGIFNDVKRHVNYTIYQAAHNLAWVTAFKQIASGTINELFHK